MHVTGRLGSAPNTLVNSLTRLSIDHAGVSYAAGITCLSFGQFALATFLGIVPICFALAATGAGMESGGTDWMWIVVLGGGITLLPVLGKWIWDRV